MTYVNLLLFLECASGLDVGLNKYFWHIYKVQRGWGGGGVRATFSTLRAPKLMIHWAPRVFDLLDTPLIRGHLTHFFLRAPRLKSYITVWVLEIKNLYQLEMLLIPNALCWSSRKCNCACALPAEVQMRLHVIRRSWQKLFAGKNFVNILVTAQTQLRSYSEQQRAFGNSNICNWLKCPGPYNDEYNLIIH